MSDTREPIGFLPCSKCHSLKSIFQGQGKRARFLYAKCGCGMDQRTGAAVQSDFSKHLPKEEAHAQLNQLTKPKNDDDGLKETKSSKAPIVIAAILGGIGLLTLRG